MEFFLAEVTVGDLARSVSWYARVLDRPPALVDEAHRYALFEAGGCRVALKQGGSGREGGGVRLTFLVPDLDGERSRLIGLGMAPGEPIANLAEGFREARLFDPDGTPITLFAWTRGPDRAP
jgi:hypothetical protein